MGNSPLINIDHIDFGLGSMDVVIAGTDRLQDEAHQETIRNVSGLTPSEHVVFGMLWPTIGLHTRTPTNHIFTYSHHNHSFASCIIHLHLTSFIEVISCSITYSLPLQKTKCRLWVSLINYISIHETKEITKTRGKANGIGRSSRERRSHSLDRPHHRYRSLPHQKVTVLIFIPRGRGVGGDQASRLFSLVMTRSGRHS